MDNSNHFTLSKSTRNSFLVLILIGILSVGYSIFSDHYGADRLWSNYLVNSMYFLGMALFAIVFVSFHTMAFSGWQIQISRIPEAMMSFVPIGGLFLLMIVLGIHFHWHHIYHWADPHVYDTASEHYDALIAGKRSYLNENFFTLRFVFYIAIWTLFAFLLRKYSLKQDKEGGLMNYHRMKFFSGVFMIVVAVTSSTIAWDFVMSIDTHWFSTLFGWYNAVSLWLGCIATVILITVFLKSQGYLAQVNENHLHDLGKYLFGFSVFWAYLWFSQYMLIWYSNIPEETAYFLDRVRNFKLIFFFNFAINFLFPFFVLMMRDAKRKYQVLVVAAVVAFFGHWLDFYLMVMPGTIHTDAGIGIPEIGMLLGFIGVFLFVIFTALGKAPLVPYKHPFFKESIEHHT